MGDATQTYGQYADFVQEGSFDPHAGQRNLEELQYLCLGLAGETGEFIDQVKKIVRAIPHDSLMHSPIDQKFFDSPEYAHLVEELGDIMWYMTRLMNHLGVSRTQVMIQNTFKLFERHKERFPDTPWPFSDPFISYDNIKERLENVRVDEKV